MADSIPSSLPLADAAYERLRADIIACRLAPGQRITERALAKETGFGVSPIRDALTRLDHDGLVRTIPRKGYQVTPLTLKVVDDLFTFWQIIGPEVVKHGVIAATDQQLDRILKDMNEIDALIPPGHSSTEVLRFVDVCNDLFTTLAESSGNSYLAATYAKLSGELLRVWTLISDSDFITPATLLNLADWSEMMRRRDGEGLAVKALEYVQACHNQVVKTLMRWPSVRTSEVVPLEVR